MKLTLYGTKMKPYLGTKLQLIEAKENINHILQQTQLS